MKDELDILPTDKLQRFLQIAIIILGVCGQACPNYLPKITSLLFLCNILRKNWVIVDFLHADKHESLLQIDSMILMGDGQAFPKFPK